MTRILKITLGARITFFFQLCFDFALGFAKNPRHKGQYEPYNCQSVPQRFCFLGRDFSFINFPFSRRQAQRSKLCCITLTFIEREANEQLLSAFRDIVVHRLWSILRTEISQLKGNRFCPFSNAFLCIFFPSFTDALIVTFGKRFQQNLAVPCLCFFFLRIINNLERSKQLLKEWIPPTRENNTQQLKISVTKIQRIKMSSYK